MAATLPLSLWLSSAGANPAGWILPGADIDIDFFNNRAYTKTGGVVLPSSLLTTVRASTKFVTNASGVLVPFLANTLPNLLGTGCSIEQAATNLCLQSQTFDNATWIKDSSIITADAVTAPDGTLTADASIANNASVSPGFHQNNLSVTNLSTYTISLMCKFGTVANNPWLEVTTIEGTVKRTFFNIQTGAIGTVGATSATTTTLTNGWFRFTITFTASSTTSTMQLYITPRPADGNSGPVTGDGVNPQFYAWGAQLETGSSATSYIPTTTAAVTRAQDSITLTTVSLPLTFSVFASAVLNTVSGGNALVGWGTASPNRAHLANSGASPLLSHDSAGFNIVPGGTWAAKTLGKMAARNQSGSYAVTFNGGTLATSANAGGPNPLSKVTFGTNADGTALLNGYLRRVTLFKSALTNAQLQALTT